jgi:hypothetical protein
LLSSTLSPSLQASPAAWPDKSKQTGRAGSRRRLPMSEYGRWVMSSASLSVCLSGCCHHLDTAGIPHLSLSLSASLFSLLHLLHTLNSKALRVICNIGSAVRVIFLSERAKETPLRRVRKNFKPTKGTTQELLERKGGSSSSIFIVVCTHSEFTWAKKEVL